MDQLFDHIQQNDNGQEASVVVPRTSPRPTPNNDVDLYVAQANDLVNLINTPFSNSDLLFGSSAVSFFPSFSSIAAPTSAPEPQPQQPAMSSQPQQNVADQSMFRHRPENPFWAVPTSLDFDAWNAYYQPRQGDSGESGSMPMMTSNNNDSNMWQ
jgi:hypothetical protein